MKLTKRTKAKNYYIPSITHWPILGAIALFCLATGGVHIIHQSNNGVYLFGLGALLLIFMIYGWFSTVINESMGGLYNQQVDRTYRWGMFWFIVSEVAFFGIFFMALFYIRLFVIPLLGSGASHPATHDYLWPGFQAAWPLLTNPNPALFKGPENVIGAWGIPAINTLILLSSAFTVTVAHWGLKKNRRWQLIAGMVLTIVLGLIFVSLQVHEYMIAYLEYHLTLNSGIYGSTFFMLTGFHAAHVMIGLTMLTVILIRCLKGHFLPAHHFAFEAVSWYWHFVDVVWLFLFVFVYWL